MNEYEYMLCMNQFKRPIMTFVYVCAEVEKGKPPSFIFIFIFCVL